MHYIFFCMGSYMKIKGLCVLAVLLTSSLAGAASNKAAVIVQKSSTTQV